MSKKDGTTSSSKSSAVSNVVNDLIRSSLGSEAQNIGDQDLDKYIADLILKEAEAKRKKYDTIGVRAYLPNTGLPPNNLPKPNKRFLLNMVRATDSHNQALLREQQQQQQQQQQRSKRKQGDDDSESEHGRKRHRHHHHRDDNRYDRSSSPSRRRHRRPCDHKDDGSENDSYRDRSRSPDRRRSRSPSSSPIRSEKQPVVRGRGKVGSSHMDTHFSKHYDPAYDIESDLDELITTEFPDVSTSRRKKRKKEKKEKKHKSKKKKKKRKHEEDESNSSDSGTEVWVEEPPKPRAWDIGKEDIF